MCALWSLCAPWSLTSPWFAGTLQMELTNDIRVLLPVMVSVMVAKWVGDFFTHPVFHAHLEMKCIPFLDPEPRVTIMGKKSVLSQPSQSPFLNRHGGLVAKASAS